MAFDLTAGAADDGAEAAVEPEAAVGVADEVEHREALFVVAAPEAATELLEEQRRALRGAQEQDGVDVGYVDALVEEVDAEQHP